MWLKEELLDRLELTEDADPLRDSDTLLPLLALLAALLAVGDDRELLYSAVLVVLTLGLMLLFGSCWFAGDFFPALAPTLARGAEDACSLFPLLVL